MTHSPRLLSLLLLLVTLPAVAGSPDEPITPEIIILDPGGNRMSWEVSDVVLAPGNEGIVRDDLLVTPVSGEIQQRLICHIAPGTDRTVTTVKRLIYVTALSDEPLGLVEIVDPGNDVGSGLKLRTQGTTINNICIYRDNDCANSGIPRNVMGEIVPGSARFHDGFAWHPVTGTVSLQAVSSTTTVCQ